MSVQNSAIIISMKNELPVRKRNDFSKVVDAYRKYRRDYPDKSYSLIYEFCPTQEAKVLDVGCGTGIVTNHLANYYKNVIGTDKEQSMIEFAQKACLENITFVTSTTENLPFDDSTFDLITVASAYHWFDYDLAGREIYRVLKPNGKLCVFWKSGRGKSRDYLPNFAFDNLMKFISVVPSANKEKISDIIFSRVGFTKINDEEFDFDDVYSKEEILGYIQSHSTYNLLDDEQKNKYMKLNNEAVDSHLVDGHFVFDSKMEMYFIEK
jgi:ubiquinone/menaquinone biosynthesis C-methylase UbiE